MAVATTAPTALEQPQVAYEPIARLARPSVTQVDVLVLAVMLSHRTD